MRLLVYGAGAVGSALGGMLASHRHDVTLLGRDPHMSAVREQGLRVSGLWGEHAVTGLRAVTTLEAVERPKEFDWVFVCVKAYQTAAAAKALVPVIGEKTFLCAFQNGLGNYDALIYHLPPERVAIGRVIFGAELEPGRVTITVWADDVLVGAPDARFRKGQLTLLADALTAAGIKTRVSGDITGAVWAKALYNCALNGLATLLEVPYGRLLEQESVRRMMRRVIEEAYAVAEAHRITLEPATAAGYCALLMSKLVPDTAAHFPSMLRDVQRGRLTEIEAINGAVVELGRQAGVSTPTNALITRLVHEKERLAGAPSRTGTPSPPRA